MDDKLIPMMAWLTVLVAAGVGYAVYSFWRSRRAVAWNVVNAALTLRGLAPAQVEAIDAAVHALLPGQRMNADSLRAAPPEVRFALYAMALRQAGIAPADAGHPFARMTGPQLARSALPHIRVVRFQAEMAHGVELTELGDATRIQRAAGLPAG